jgi:hypothetical protein
VGPTYPLSNEIVTVEKVRVAIAELAMYTPTDWPGGRRNVVDEAMYAPPEVVVSPCTFVTAPPAENPA